MTPAPLADADLDALQRELDRVPAPLEPLDVSTLDGFLCGVLVQPAPVAPQLWLPFVTDIDGRALPVDFAAARLHDLALRRHAELERAISRRAWFDPWVFELAPDASDSAAADAAEATLMSLQAVYPWVAGFAAAMNAFPALLDGPALALTEPLAMLYRHLDPDDLEDADSLLETIAALPPALDLADAVEDLVRATLMLADAGRPLPRPTPMAQRRARPRR